MPHGDFSDVAAFTCAAVGIASISKPSLWFESWGPIKPVFDAQQPTPESLAVIKFAGGLLMFMFPVLYVVRWNKINGKAAALGCLVASGTIVHTSLSLDGFEFVPRSQYLFAAFLVLSALHLAFNANPMLTSAMLKEKEDAKAKKKA